MKSLRYASILVPLCLLGVSTAHASSKSVVVTNNTPYTLTEFYASDVDSSGWDTTTNMMAGQSVGPGQHATVVINDGTSQCDYDLMAVLNGAVQHAYEYRVDTCDGSTWTINQ
ncbi:MAG: hypothetical protein IVW54_15135 [Candidatus Binataceae bacterium]|nr:hypothetical protein [Candidatus Binataceae bacterium]